MTGKEYADIIDGFDVENNSKYLPSGGYTYCNIFAQDVADACDTPLPTGGCENMWNSLAHNQFPKWWSGTYKQGQSRANDGIPSIGITKDHVVIVRPNNGSVPSDVKYVRIAQAGKTCYNNTTLAYAWGAAARSNVRFYSWYETGQPDY